MYVYFSLSSSQSPPIFAQHMRLVITICALLLVCNGQKLTSWITRPLDTYVNERVVPKAIVMSEPVIKRVVQRAMKKKRINLYYIVEANFGPEVAEEVLDIARKDACSRKLQLSKKNKKMGREDKDAPTANFFAKGACSLMFMGTSIKWRTETMRSIQKFVLKMTTKVESDVVALVSRSLISYHAKPKKIIKPGDKKRNEMKFSINSNIQPPPRNWLSKFKVMIQNKVTAIGNTTIDGVLEEVESHIDPVIDSVYSESVAGILRILKHQIDMAGRIVGSAFGMKGQGPSHVDSDGDEFFDALEFQDRKSKMPKFVAAARDLYYDFKAAWKGKELVLTASTQAELDRATIDEGPENAFVGEELDAAPAGESRFRWMSPYQWIKRIRDGLSAFVDRTKQSVKSEIMVKILIEVRHEVELASHGLFVCGPLCIENKNTFLLGYENIERTPFKDRTSEAVLLR